MNYRIQEPGTTISGFADSKKKKYMPTDPRFFLTCDSKHTHFFFLALVRKDMDVGQHERLSNITLRLKLQQRNHAFIAVQHFKATVGSSTMNLIVL